MPSELSRNISTSCQSSENKWDKAITDAEFEIESLTKQTERLRMAVKVFKANKRDGVPWPGENQPEKVG